MASRAEQKAAARAARVAHQQQLSAAQTRRKRLFSLGALAAGVAVALVVVVLAGGGGGSSGTQVNSKTGRATVIALLKGIPQNGTTIGNPNAPVTVTEFGDLACPTCQTFALTSEQQLISDAVRPGKVKLVYRGFETASSTANNGEYAASQIAARAAGVQQRAWYYILLFYYQQGSELSPYITDSYLQGLAQQVPGLKLPKWQADRNDPTLANEVTADGKAATTLGVAGTPAIFVSGPKGTGQATSAVPTLGELQALIQQVR